MILISPISDFPTNITPIINEFAPKIEKHIFLYDERVTPRDVKNLKSGLKCFIDDHKLNIQTSEILIDGTQKDKLSLFVSDLLKEAKDASDLFINATDTSPHAIWIMAEIFKQGGNVIVYDKTENRYTLLYKDTIVTHPISRSMNIKEYCTLLGMKISSCKTKKEILKNKETIFRLNHDIKRFKKVRGALLGHSHGFDFSEYRDILEDLRHLGILDSNDKLINATYLSGGILEHYIFLLAEPLGFDDIMINVEIEVGYAGLEPIKNELDIAMIKDNHFYTIECKSGRHVKGKHIVYKYDSIIDWFGKDSKAMIVNISKSHKKRFAHSRGSKTFSRQTIERALLYNIYVYYDSKIHEKDLIQTIRKFFSV